MRCKVGDLAIVLKSYTGRSEGKVVSVVEYIGFCEGQSCFDYRGHACLTPITDNYWWVTAPTPFDTAFGPTSRAYVPDSWLKPIGPDLLDDDEETGRDIYSPITADNSDLVKST